MHGIGDRVQEQISRVCPNVPHRDIARDIQMTPDAFSRALNDKRAFSAIELARLADRLGADIHWLITGEPDPHRLVVAARHNFDHETGRREVPGREADDQVLENIALAYRQAYTEPLPAVALPRSADRIRSVLGQDFVRPFATFLENKLGIDVVRVTELSTAYSLTIGGRRVIVIPATGNWFWENWSIAHEMGHLLQGHHDQGVTATEWDALEEVANRFAADLLLPAQTLVQINWAGVGVGELADLIWRWGVSTDALARRLSTLTGQVPDVVREWAGQPTQRLLRRHWAASDKGRDEITLRMDAAASRRFPLALQDEHLKKIESGLLGKESLAWMLDIDPDALEVDVPSVSEVDVDDLAKALAVES